MPPRSSQKSPRALRFSHRLEKTVPPPRPQRRREEGSVPDLETIEGDIDSVGVSPFGVLDIDGFARALKTPTSMFVDVRFLGGTEGDSVVSAATFRVSLSTAVVHVKAPKTILNGVVKTSEGAKEGVASCLHLQQTWVDKVMAKR